MTKKHSLVIIEPSPIVALGLKQMLATSKDFAVTATLKNLTDYNESQHGSADIIIINPIFTLGKAHTEVKTLIPTHTNCVFIALTYGPYNESIFQQYDGIIGLFLTFEQIEKRLNVALNSVQEKPRDENKELSTREREILTAVAKGKTNKEIADEFNLSIYTVVSHRKNISQKLGINSISGLTIYAIINKIINVNDF